MNLKIRQTKVNKWRSQSWWVCSCFPTMIIIKLCIGPYQPEVLNNIIDIILLIVLMLLFNYLSRLELGQYPLYWADSRVAGYSFFLLAHCSCLQLCSSVSCLIVNNLKLFSVTVWAKSLVRERANFHIKILTKISGLRLYWV